MRMKKEINQYCKNGVVYWIYLIPETNEELQLLKDLWNHKIEKMGCCLHGDAHSKNPTQHSIENSDFLIKVRKK